MKKYLPSVILLLSILTTKVKAQNVYACFENDKNKKLTISVCFDKNQRAKYVKYNGQKDSIRIFYSRITKSKNTGGIPAVYWAEDYVEKVNGKITGEYTFTNAGTYQLDVTYTRKKDNKEFYFSIIEGTFDEADRPFRKGPCF